ncbi:SDR family oxidoreductase [Tenacibaculum amylolyticum]|uniref:SDR family oxidoreductase n=1 Tax=Tenacibaculum amylolyticum TaxID=104269 RepID=UPI003892D793
MKKIVITGSNGLLGQTLVNLLVKEKENYEVIGFSRGENRSGRNDFEYVSIDITNREDLFEKLAIYKPDVIVNTAAMTQVDMCEDAQKECDAINVTLVDDLIIASKEFNTHIIQLSTDFIFDGKKGYYKEDDIANPLSYYGQSKLKAEELLTTSYNNYTILRTILVYGQVYDMSRSNIVLWVKESLENQKEITIVNDQYRMPTYVESLAEACKLAIDNHVLGVFNISSNELLSVYEIAQQIAEVFKLDKTLIKPISSETLNQRAKRPAKTGFNLEKTKKELGFMPNSFKKDLQIFKQKLT